MKRHIRHNSIDNVVLYGLAVLSVIFLSNTEKYFISTKKIATETKVVEKNKVTVPLFNQSAFTQLKIKGQAYVVYDIVNKKVIAGKNEEEVLPLASLTKIMTSLTAKLHNKEGSSITIEKNSIEGAYDLGLKNGQVWKLNELLKYTLVFSSNDAALAIADAFGGRKLFIDLMNKDATTLGLSLHFTHPAGLDEDGQIGGLGSALSAAKLASVAHQKFPEIFDATTKKRLSVTSSTGKIIGIPNTNQDVFNLPGLELSKTGYTDKAGGNLVVVVDILVGHPVVIVVLGSTREERFSDVQGLYNALQKSIVR